MRTIIYFSHATRPLSSADLIDLERECATNDGPLRLTGVLLHCDGRFLQLIEGPKGVMRDMWARIQADPRHERFQVVLDRHGRQRCLAMSCMRLSDLSRDVSGATFPAAFNEAAFASDARRALDALLAFCRAH